MCTVISAHAAAHADAAVHGDALRRAVHHLSAVPARGCLSSVPVPHRDVPTGYVGELCVRPEHTADADTASDANAGM